MRYDWTRTLTLTAITLALTLAGCASRQKVKTLEQEAADRGAALEELRAENADVKDQLSKARSELASVRTELADAKQSAAAAPPPAAPVAVQDTDRVLLVLDGDSFSAGKDALSLDAKKSLQTALAEIRAAAKTSYLRIEGHTDNQPIRKTKDKYKSNVDLAAARAMSVLSYLETVGRVSPEKMYIAAYGPHRPIASNKTAKGRSSNRRVQIVQTAK